MNGPRLSLAASLTGFFFIFTLYACTQQNTHSRDAALGKVTFQEHCASCHGPDGKGDGPLAADLDKTVPDLTLLVSKFDGVYPAEYVLGTIDGRQEFLAHGTRMMPIWGNIWRPGMQTSHAAEVEAQRLMNGLLHYMESIQE
jgi:mono/diheme cytochrome c family protein